MKNETHDSRHQSRFGYRYGYIDIDVDIDITTDLSKYRYDKEIKIDVKFINITDIAVYKHK